MIHRGFYDKFRRVTISIPRWIFIGALFGYGIYADIRLQIFVDVSACEMFVMKSYIANISMQPDLTGGSDYPLSHSEHEYSCDIKVWNISLNEKSKRRI